MVVTISKSSIVETIFQVAGSNDRTEKEERNADKEGHVKNAVEHTHMVVQMVRFARGAEENEHYYAEGTGSYGAWTIVSCYGVMVLQRGVEK